MNKEQEDYKIVVKNTIIALEPEVKNYIKKGWQTTGGIVVVNYGNDIRTYCQTLVKYKNNG